MAWLVASSSGVNGGSPWAESPREGASKLLECALGRYSFDVLVDWQLPVGFDAEGVAGRVAAEPDVWTDGSLVEDNVSGVSSSGGFAVATVLFLVHCSLFRGLSFGVLFLLCKLMMGYVLGATILELYGMLAASWMAGLLLVLLNWLGMVVLFCTLKGCFISEIYLDTVRITKVKGHADLGMVLDGAADEAADCGCGGLVMLVHRFLLPPLGLWLTMMAVMVLLLNLQFGPLVPSPRGVGWFRRVGTGFAARTTCYLGI